MPRALLVAQALQGAARQARRPRVVADARMRRRRAAAAAAADARRRARRRPTALAGGAAAARAGARWRRRRRRGRVCGAARRYGGARCWQRAPLARQKKKVATFFSPTESYAPEKRNLFFFVFLRKASMWARK